MIWAILASFAIGVLFGVTLMAVVSYKKCG